MAIQEQVKRRLWASSGGYCQNPTCRTELFRFFASGKATSIEELAHVIARKQSGARGGSKLSESQRDEFENLIMLCPTCHTLIDKNAEEFPVDLLLRWKAEHQTTISNALLCPVFSSRTELRTCVRKLLARNRQIFDTYGPYSAAATEPLSDAADTWERMSITDLIPNNRKVVDLLNTNEHLLTDAEQQTAQEFLIHAEAFEYNHLSGDKTASDPLFPESMNNILLGET